MVPLWRWVLVLVILACLLVQYQRLYAPAPARKEGFLDVLPSNDDLPVENLGKWPWERHPIGDSIPIDLRDKYPHAYYHEMDHNAYQAMLRELFAVPADRYELATGQGPDFWSEDVGQVPDLVPGYEAALGYIQSRLSGAGDIQVVHDRWVGCKQSRAHPQLHLYKLELVLYRSFRSHGKHVGMDIMVEKKANGGYHFDVIGIGILGSIMEDKIALFPVRAYDPWEVSEARMEGTPFSAKNQPLLDEATVQMIVQKVQENRAKEASEGRR